MGPSVTGWNKELCHPDNYPILKTLPYELMFVTISGSHLYGFNSQDSDVDLRGVHVPWTEDVFKITPPQETVERMEGIYDIATHEVSKYIHLLLKNPAYCLEQLYSPLVVISSGWHAELKEIGRRCVNKKSTKHYLGFTNSQLNMLRRRPDKEVKILLYVFRTLLSGLKYAQEGIVEPNLLTLNAQYKLSYLDELIEQKLKGQEKSGLAAGGNSMEFYLKQSSILMAKVEAAIDTSPLPEHTDPKVVEELNDFLLRLRRSFWRSYKEGSVYVK